MAKFPSKRSGGKSPKKNTPPAKGGPKHKAAKRPGWMPAPPPPGARGAPVRTGGGPKSTPRPAPHRDPNFAREAARYEQPIASREMLLRILEANEGPMDIDALASKLALTEPD